MVDLRVPKRRVPVEILLPGGAVRRVAVFLADAAPGHPGPERLSDILNGTEEFFPAHDEGEKAMSFVRRGAVALARVASEIEPDDEAATLPPPSTGSSTSSPPTGRPGFAPCSPSR